MFDASSEIAQSDNMGLGPPLPGSKWRRALACTASTCVEVRFRVDGADLRDSKELGKSNPGILGFSSLAWADFLRSVGSQTSVGSETSTVAGGVEIQVDELGGVTLVGGNSQLWFDASEWTAFRSGVEAGEFNLSESVYANAS